MEEFSEEQKEMFYDFFAVSEEQVTFYITTGARKINATPMTVPDTMYPGGPIYVLTPQGVYTSRLSIGYRCYMRRGSENLYGFITAAHGTELGYGIYSAPYASSSYYIGYVHTRVFGNPSSVDAAFVYTDTGANISTVTRYGGNSVAMGYMASDYPSYIYVEGSTSCARQLAKVSNPSYYYYIDDYLFNDVIALDEVTNSAGDSGGIAYCANTSGVYSVVGIMSAVEEDTTFVVKHSNIVSALNITCY